MLPRPAQWSKRERPTWFKQALMVAPALAVLAFGTGLRSLLIGVPVGVLAVALLAAALLWRGPRSVQVSFGELRLDHQVLRGAQFPLRRSRLAVVGWALLAVVFGLGAAVLLVAAVVQREPLNLVGTVLLGGISFVFGAALRAYLRRDKVNPPSLTLSETGIVLVHYQPQLIRWEDVGDVAAAVQVIRARMTLRYNVITISAAAGATSVRTTQLGSEPTAVYHAIRYYWRSPQARAELRDETAINRIRAGRYGSVGGRA